VLRISSVSHGGSRVTLKVEGTLVGEWVALLEAECLSRLDEGEVVELDFADVSLVNRSGIVMVRALIAKGVGVIGANALVNALLGLDGVQ
jgi:positive regulator of sigma E activity